MIEVNADQADVVEYLCPVCGIEVPTHRCRLCGSTRTINQVSGKVIWMKNGRVVRAFTDSRQAYIKMAEEYNIPQNRWPKQFRD